MKKIFTLLALGSVSLLSADQYYGSQSGYCPTCENNDAYGQGQYYQGQYYQGQPSSQGQYYQGQYYQGQPSQGQSYQGQSSQGQSYDREQNRNYGRDNDQNSQYGNSQAGAPNRDLGRRIREALNLNISFAVDNGVVTIRGTVGTAERKNRIEEIVKKIDGVKKVDNQLVVAKAGQKEGDQRDDSQRDGSQRDGSQKDDQVSDSDRQIGRNIRDALSAGYFSKGYKGVNFEVLDGNVTLRGSVETPDEKKEVEGIVKKLSGVNSVNNQISINNQRDGSNQKEGNRKYSAQVSDSDRQIGRDIRDAFNTRDFKGINFEVKDGVVTLKGSVDTSSNKGRAEDAVKRIEGVKKVINQITVGKESFSGNDISDSKLQASEKKYPQDKAATNQDRQLNAKIRDKLSGGFLSKDYELLVIKTANGVVVITGTVDKEDDLQKINDKLSTIDGIKRIDNQAVVNDT